MSKKLAGWIAKKAKAIGDRADAYARRPGEERCVVCLREFFDPERVERFSGPWWNPDHPDTCDDCAPGGGDFLPAGFR